MNKWTKKLHWHFIPSHENAFKPHALRFPAAASMLGLIVAIEALYLIGAFVVLPSSNYFAAVFASVLVDQTNKERQTEALSTLKTNPILERAALMKAEDMAAKGYFSHHSPDGKTPWYWFEQAGYDYAAAGENLAVNFVDSQDVTNAWMQSPTHRANIMSGNYTEIGIAVVSGIYKGREAIFVVQEFGRPSLVAQEMPISNAALAPVKPATAVVAMKKSAPSVPKTTGARDSSLVAGTSPTTTSVAGVEIQKSPIAALGEARGEPADVGTIRDLQNLNNQSGLIKVAEAAEPEPPSSIDMLVASPRRLTTTIYSLFAVFVALLLGLAIFIKIRIQHPHLIVNGVLLIAITLSLVLVNGAVSFMQGMI